MARFFYESLTGANTTAGTDLVQHTPDAGGPWLASTLSGVAGSTFLFDANSQVYNSIATASLYTGTATGALTGGAANHYAIATIHITSLQSSYMGPVLRASANNGYFLRATTGGGGAALIGKIVAGVLSNISGTLPFAAWNVNGQTGQLLLVATGTTPTTLSAYYSLNNGVSWTLLGTVTDSSFPGGGSVGLLGSGTVSGATTGPHLASLAAYDAPVLTCSVSTLTANAQTTLTLTCLGANWTPGTPGSPAFTIAGNTGVGAGAPAVVSQTITNPMTATLVVYPGQVGGTVTITDPSSGQSVSLPTYTGYPFYAPFGPGWGGLVGSVGYTIYDMSSNVLAARSTAGISEIPAGSGYYGALAPIPDTWEGVVVWDTGAGSLVTATETIAKVRAGAIAGNVAGNVLGAVLGGVQGGMSGNLTGSVSGSVASVTGAVGSVSSPVTTSPDPNTALIKAQTDKLSFTGTYVNTASDANVSAIRTQTDKIAFDPSNNVKSNTQVQTDKAGYVLDPTGLDHIVPAEPSSVADASSSLPKLLKHIQLSIYSTKVNTGSSASGTQVVYNSAGTPVGTMTYTNAAGVFSQQKAT